MTLREIIIDRILDALMESRNYEDYLYEIPDTATTRFTNTKSALQRINDTMLIRVYDRVVSAQGNFIPMSASVDGSTLAIRVGTSIYGEMLSDGSTHT